MDIIALIDGVFVEFSENYYFEFPDNFITRLDKGDSVLPYLLKDVFKYFEEGKKFKSLKRLFSFYRYKGKKAEMAKLIHFFNSPIGKFNQQINSLHLLVDIIDNTFRPVKIEDIKRNLKIIEYNVPVHYRFNIKNIIQYNSLEAIKKKINDIIKQMEKEIDRDVLDFIKTQKFNIA